MTRLADAQDEKLDEILRLVRDVKAYMTSFAADMQTLTERLDNIQTRSAGRPKREWETEAEYVNIVTHAIRAKGDKGDYVKLGYAFKEEEKWQVYFGEGWGQDKTFAPLEDVIGRSIQSLASPPEHSFATATKIDPLRIKVEKQVDKADTSAEPKTRYIITNFELVHKPKVKGAPKFEPLTDPGETDDEPDFYRAALAYATDQCGIDLDLARDGLLRVTTKVEANELIQQWLEEVQFTQGVGDGALGLNEADAQVLWNYILDRNNITEDDLSPHAVDIVLAGVETTKYWWELLCLADAYLPDIAEANKVWKESKHKR